LPITREETPFSPGTTGASDPNVPIAPTLSANATGTITINAPGANGNDAVVTYVIRVTYPGYTKYIQADGTVGAGEIAQTLAVWGATIIITGLTVFIPYTFAAKAINELATASAYSAESAVMNTLPDVDYGPQSANLDRIVTGGNTIVDEVSGLVISGTEVTALEATQTALPEYYGDITITYKLVNDDSTASRVVVEYSEDGTNWYTATKGTGGDALTALTTSPAGVTHTFVWDSYSDAGTSELDTEVFVRITPYDASPTGGDPADAVSSAGFAVNNRPAIIVWLNADNRTFSKDTTPTFNAIIPALRGGSNGFPEISIYRTTGMVLVGTFGATASIAGWEYETSAPDPSEHWTALTVTGIPSNKINGALRMRFTPPIALSAGDYTINGRLGETRDEG
jgi:hypothetical protein